MKKTYIFLIALTLVFSCEREDNFTQEQQQVDKIEVENGILSFSSKDFLSP